MKKTSLYLTPEEEENLRRLAAATGLSRAQIVREAITEYAANRPAEPRVFRCDGVFDSGRKGTSITDDIDELLEGFGEDRE